MLIEIVHWEKYNGKRQDSKSCTWFRMQQEFAYDGTLREMTVEERYVWVCLLCQASLISSNMFFLGTKGASQIFGVDEKFVKSAIEKLESFQYVRVTLRDTARGTSRGTAPTDVRTGRTDGRTDGSAGNMELPATQDEKTPTLGSEIFASYAAAYRSRYGKDPIRNAMVSRNCQDLGKRLGRDAIGVAAFYVGHNKAYYVQQCHPVGVLLKDAEGLHTQWHHGKQVLPYQARQVELAQNNADAFGSLLKEAREKEKNVSEGD